MEFFLQINLRNGNSFPAKGPQKSFPPKFASFNRRNGAEILLIFAPFNTSAKILEGWDGILCDITFAGNVSNFVPRPAPEIINHPLACITPSRFHCSSDGTQSSGKKRRRVGDNTAWNEEASLNLETESEWTARPRGRTSGLFAPPLFPFTRSILLSTSLFLSFRSWTGFNLDNKWENRASLHLSDDSTGRFLRELAFYTNNAYAVSF